MLRILSLSFFVLFSSTSFAASKINFMKVDSDMVFFSTEGGKSGSRPSCAVSSTNNQWAVSLKTESGRGIYSLLVMAMASKLYINIESAQDCGDFEGVERPKSVSLDGSTYAPPPPAPVAPVEIKPHFRTVGYYSCEIRTNFSRGDCSTITSLNSERGYPYSGGSQCQEGSVAVRIEHSGSIHATGRDVYACVISN